MSETASCLLHGEFDARVKRCPKCEIERSAPHVNVVVKARCVACRNERDIGPGEIREGEVPMCEKCFSPMVAMSLHATLSAE